MLKGETCAVIRPAQPLRELLYPAVEKLDNGFIPNLSGVLQAGSHNMFFNDLVGEKIF